MVRVTEVDTTQTWDIHLTGTEWLPGSGKEREERSTGVECSE
jgi:hypothetical protein